MRVMVIVKATENSEAGHVGTEEEFDAMGKFNVELVAAGVMLAGDGIAPSSRGKRIRFADRQTTVVDGPFAETKELVSGYWIWQVGSMDEAMEWAQRVPFVDGELEVRPIMEIEDLGENFTPDMRVQEQKLRSRIADQGQ
ncbi:Uncharacterized conserved protein [Jatrophihabitans endophyticus]|uniref:Uncharacterized conserved protein n=1 Tax=Jatrophihabitans endophyticus TaxID=1206085 RepID=A0A1M5TRP2_9ACTN|nr:YciI family protein [Jatrophihabitans endophyticus]SHH53330.1 Uncharacterized conserved protein [Jatrophihabitans endophyticus]